MSYITKYVTDFVKTKISSISPFKVEEIGYTSFCSDYKKYEIIEQNGSFTLYKVASYYELIYLFKFENKDKVFSLYRYQGNIMDAKRLQERYVNVITLLETVIMSNGKLLLEKICVNINNHKFWTAAHIAAHLGMMEAFRLQQLVNIINVPDNAKGITPLHVAVSSGNENLVKELLLVDGINLDVLDFESNSVLHLAAAHDTNVILNLLINKSASSINILNKSGKSAVHIACEAKSKSCLEMLLKFGADPYKNKNSEYPIHIAMRLHCIECIEVLCLYYPDCINMKNLEDGSTVMHMFNTRTEIIKLLKLGADINARNNLGCTPLHLKVKENDFECVFALMTNGANPNIKCQGNRTPLHVAIKDCDVDIIRCLIVFEVEVNAIDDRKETARHILCKQKNRKYQHSKTRDMVLYTLNAVGAARCENDKNDCTDGCIAGGSFNGSSPTPILSTVNHSKDVLDETILAAYHYNEKVPLESKKSQADFENQDSHWFYLKNDDYTENLCKKPGLRLLSLDGGGIRGLILVQTLRALERVSQRSIKSMFDWIGGTSTGGLLAISIVYGMSLHDCRIMYLNLKDQVFIGKRPYSSDVLERIVKENVGENTTMMSVTSPKLTVTALHCDRFPPKLHLFRNYEPPLSNYKKTLLQNHKGFMSSSNDRRKSYATHDPDSFNKGYKHPSEQLVWEAAKATGAAPTFFRACGSYLDGGLISNNPTLDLLTEIVEYNLVKRRSNQSEEPLGMVVSIGTGRAPIIPISTVDVFRPNNPLDVYNIVQGMSILTKVIVEMATGTEGRLVDRARAWCHSINVPFFRFSPPLSDDIPLDETDDKVIIQMLWETEAYLYRSNDRLKKLSELI